MHFIKFFKSSNKVREYKISGPESQSSAVHWISRRKTDYTSTPEDKFSAKLY